MEVTQDFLQMAFSFYGCDGGNLSSEVWTCGLEWGGGHQNNQIVKNEMKPLSLGAWDQNGECVLGCLMAQYNQKLAWFFSYLYGWDSQNYKNEALEHGLFCKNGIGFKMNAFPISFRNRSSVQWSEKTKTLTGLNSFHDYREWCIEYRGAYFQLLMKAYSPKIILCTGISSSNEFIRFFGGNIDCKKDLVDLHVCPVNNKKTLLFVSPFFGNASGINSYKKMEALTNKIKQASDQFFNEKVFLQPA